MESTSAPGCNIPMYHQKGMAMITQCSPTHAAKKDRLKQLLLLHPKCRKKLSSRNLQLQVNIKNSLLQSSLILEEEEKMLALVGKASKVGRKTLFGTEECGPSKASRLKGSSNIR